MASITIRNLDDEIKDRLRIRAAHRRRSMEDEARNILREALVTEVTSSTDLVAAISKRFRGLGHVELDFPAREPVREPPSLSE